MRNTRISFKRLAQLHQLHPSQRHASNSGDDAPGHSNTELTFGRQLHNAFLHSQVRASGVVDSLPTTLLI